MSKVNASLASMKIEKRGGYRGGMRAGSHPWLQPYKVKYTAEEDKARREYLHDHAARLAILKRVTS